MIRIRIVILLIGIVISSQLSARTHIEAQPILTKLLDQYIRPSYKNFSERTSILVDRTEALCSEPGFVQLEAAKEQFQHVALSWARAEWLRVGPVISDNRLERVLFYPDRKGTGLRQVQRALGIRDKTVLESTSLSKKSVAMQGLGALEFLLFGTGHEALTTHDDEFRCLYALAISKNLHQLAHDMNEGWKTRGTYATYWVKPSADNPLFRNDLEALNRVIGTIIHGLEAQRDVRLGAFLKSEAQLDRPKSALFWRSDLTLKMITQGLAGLADIYTIAGLAEHIPEDQSWLKSSMAFELNQSVRTAGSFEAPVASLLADAASRERLVYLRLAINFAIERLDGALSPALGLQAGFSFGDGD